MLKKLLLIILLTSQISFSQTEKDDYMLYSMILTEQLKFGANNKIDSILIIEKFDNREDLIAGIFVSEKDSISSFDISYLSANGADSIFIKLLIEKPKLKKKILSLTSDFKPYPEIKAKLLETDKLNIQTITSKKYYSFFEKKYARKNAWKKILKKYGTRNILEFSNVNYQGNLAATYYGKYCGGLCGNGSIVIFEKVNGQWGILTEISLWMS